MVSYFSYDYQYTWSYSDLSNIYELGNNSVAMDTVLYGKIPIIDYFSAHALDDVWTKIVYCLIHGDVNGILVDPYGGLSEIISFIVLFFIVSELLHEDIAVLFVVLFPGIITGIKWVSICSISIAALLYIYRKPNRKTFVIYWLLVFIGAIMIYDEGLSLGIASILSYLIVTFIQKEWKHLKWFVLCGMLVGFSALGFYSIYGVFTGLPIVSRVREWISVSVGSSSSWATVDYGDQSTFAFWLSYFIVPMTAVALLVFTLIRYVRTKKNGKLVVVTVTYALAELLYITRTIVYHNLAVCSGVTGVLLNFIHWTVALYVLYRASENERKENFCITAWAGIMMAVIIFEGTAVTKYWPVADSMLLSKGLKASEEWELRDDIIENCDQDRIVYDDVSTAFVNQFTAIFDYLLDSDQTYIDFANVTSMYLLTGRVRPGYVGQTPSLLTDLYSQECYLKEISEYDCPLAVLGTTGSLHIQQMIGIPHNIRYYKIAEYIYARYRPLVTFGEFVIWCEKDLYHDYYTSLSKLDLNSLGYTLVDYGYDFTTLRTDENGDTVLDFKPYHSYNLDMIPYIWANYDDYDAINQTELLIPDKMSEYYYHFGGSQKVVSERGNYLAFECTNSSTDNVDYNILFYDSANEGAKVEYHFQVVPGMSSYIIRVSQDYFWDIYNVDTVLFGNINGITVDNVRILEGD